MNNDVASIKLACKACLCLAGYPALPADWSYVNIFVINISGCMVVLYGDICSGILVADKYVNCGRCRCDLNIYYFNLNQPQYGFIVIIWWNIVNHLEIIWEFVFLVSRVSHLDCITYRGLNVYRTCNGCIRETDPYFWSDIIRWNLHIHCPCFLC